MRTKLIFAAFAAAAMFAACTETALNSPDGKGKKGDGDLITNGTAVTFVLKLDNKKPGTKAQDQPYAPETTFGGSGSTELFIDPSDVRLMIFDDMGSLEINQAFDMGTLYTIYNPSAPTDPDPYATTTVLVTAGAKKIFVFANTGRINHTSSTKLNDELDNFSGSLSDFYLLYFDAGTPQDWYLTNSGDPRTFVMNDLYNQGASAPYYGLPASNNNQIDYVLVANVDDVTSNAGTASSTGTSTTNTFAIDLRFMIARARLSFSGISGTDHLYQMDGSTQVAYIHNLKYAIHNLAKNTSYIQRVSGGNPRSYYHETITSQSTAQAFHFAGGYKANFDHAADPTVEIKASADLSGEEYLYLPESTSAYMTRGQVPYFCITANYVPKIVVNSITWNAAAAPPVGFGTPLDLTTTPTDQSYVYVLKEITGPNGNIPANTCFKNVGLLEQAAWLIFHGSGSTGGWDPMDSGQQAQLGVIFPLATKTPSPNPPYDSPDPWYVYPFNDESLYIYYEFTDAQSWYRWEVGTDNYVSLNIPKFGAVRGYSYEAEITGIRGPGKPYKWMLDTNDPDPIEAYTYVTVTVTILDWITAPKTGEI